MKKIILVLFVLSMIFADSIGQTLNCHIYKKQLLTEKGKVISSSEVTASGKIKFEYYSGFSIRSSELGLKYHFNSLRDFYYWDQRVYIGSNRSYHSDRILCPHVPDEIFWSDMKAKDKWFAIKLYGSNRWTRYYYTLTDFE